MGIYRFHISLYLGNRNISFPLPEVGSVEKWNRFLLFFLFFFVIDLKIIKIENMARNFFIRWRSISIFEEIETWIDIVLVFMNKLPTKAIGIIFFLFFFSCLSWFLYQIAIICTAHLGIKIWIFFITFLPFWKFFFYLYTFMVSIENNEQNKMHSRCHINSGSQSIPYIFFYIYVHTMKWIIKRWNNWWRN